MIRALLLGAFATSALGSCGKDISAYACTGFGPNSDFNVANDGTTNVLMSGNMVVNGATTYIGTGPWARTLQVLSAQPNGCAYRDTSTSGDLTTNSMTGSSSGWTCGSTGSTTVCAGAANQEQATRGFQIGFSLQAMVASLDNAGRFAVYFQRVLANPVLGAGITLKWIAENACKVYVDVEFECTGGNCVEVTTIVCASFAGINTDNTGTVAIECKVPNGFSISSTNPAAAAPTLGAELTVTGVSNLLQTGVDADVWAGATPLIVGGTMSYTSSGLTGVLNGEVTTLKSLAQNERFAGTVNTKAWIRQTTIWTTDKQNLHEATYNLTRASNVARTFNMLVNVLFYSDENAAVLTTATAIAAKFPNAAIQRPFLARTNVEYGTITQHQHGYLSAIAKVNTAGDVTFANLRVSEVVHTVQGGASVSEPPSPTTSHCTQVGGTSYHGTTFWPKAYLSCQGLMDASTTLRATAVTAGDTLTMSLKWQLVGTAVSSGAGKAALLQDAADEVQSVEVSLTIQLGGGETTITTAGGSDGSADPTVTYIIIAVCIVAAGLILAVVVVAFMCMRNRSQEAIVSMSPQKCTVAAVYDISQPKKADAMDV